MANYAWSKDTQKLTTLLNSGMSVIYRHGPKNLGQIQAVDGRIDLNQNTRFGHQWVRLDEFVSLFTKMGYEFVDPAPTNIHDDPSVDANGLWPCPICGDAVGLFTKPSPDGTIIWHKLAHGPTSECSISMIAISLEDLQSKWNRRP